MLRPRLFASAFLVTVLAAAGCSSGTRARDVAGDRRPRRESADAGHDAAASGEVPEPPQVIAPPVVAGRKARTFVRASARALAIDAANLYYGDSEDDGLYAMPKAGGEAVRLARHAPVAGAIALDGEAVTWIASPGDIVLRIGLRGGGQPSTLRDRGIFSDVATAGGDVFITEAIGAGGALLRVTGATATRIASFDGAPRAVMTDATHAYVVTPTKVLRTPHLKGDVETIATGTGFANPQMDASFVYVVADADRARVVVRVPKTGGAVTTVVGDVRDAPIDIEGSELFYFDGVRSQVRAVRVTGGESRVVVDDDALTAPTAIAVDATTVFLATGARESGLILAVPRR